MTWKLTDEAKDKDPIPGVPWRDMTEDEFREVAKAYAERNHFPPRALHGSGFFDHDEKPAEKPKED